MRLRYSLMLVLTLVCPVAARAQEHMTTPAFHGFLFGDVVYVARERATTDGFLVGQMVGHGNARLSDRVSFFGEVSATARSDSYAFEVERAIIRYDFADYLKISAGRYHTPVSYWNVAYHHGLWLQTTVARPEIVKVGGRFIPVHFIGVVAEGTLNASAGSLSYEAGIGNGRGAVISRGGDAGDLNRSRASVMTLRARPGDFGLQIGGSLYYDDISVVPGQVDEQIASAHIVWDRGAPEFAAEYAVVRHEPDAGGNSVDSEGWYVHAGMRLPGPLSKWKPYVRLERLDSKAGDPVFSTIGSAVADYRAAIGGVRFDFDGLAALKAEYRRERFGNGPDVNGLYLQVAFAIAVSGGMQ